MKFVLGWNVLPTEERKNTKTTTESIFSICCSLGKIICNLLGHRIVSSASSLNLCVRLDGRSVSLPCGQLNDLCGNDSKNMEINTLHVSRW
jgi:hypothetical protein